MKSARELLNQTLEAGENFHRLGIWAMHRGLFLISGFTAFWLRFDGEIPSDVRSHMAWGLGIWLITKAVVFPLFGLDRGWWQFVSVDDAVRLAVGNGVASMAAYVLIRLFAPPFFPRSLYLLDLVICFLTTS